MKIITQDHLDQAITILHQGGVIAYPTEAVYGLGCDPYNEQAIQKLLLMKQRSANKALILIAHDWQQVSHLVQPIPTQRLELIQSTWPGHVTWIFPASAQAPKLALAQDGTISLRITNHPIANELCKQFRGPIISTSANLSKQPEAKSSDVVQQLFAEQLDGLVIGELGNYQRPSEVRHAITGEIIRPG